MVFMGLTRGPRDLSGHSTIPLASRVGPTQRLLGPQCREGSLFVCMERFFNVTSTRDDTLRVTIQLVRYNGLSICTLHVTIKIQWSLYLCVWPDIYMFHLPNQRISPQKVHEHVKWGSYQLVPTWISITSNFIFFFFHESQMKRDSRRFGWTVGDITFSPFSLGQVS